MAPFYTFEEYLDERILFCEALNSGENHEIGKVLQDFKWAKKRLIAEGEGENISWDEIAQVIIPHILKTNDMCIENHNCQFLPNYIRLEAKEISDSLIKICNEILGRCKRPSNISLQYL